MALMAVTEPAETIEIGGQAVPRHYGDPAAEYAAAHTGAVVVPRSHEGRVRASGRDRLDLLHRMSTNDLASLAPGQARATVLTTAVARIVDLLWVLHRGETVLFLTSPGRATPVRRWLATYTFYNDQVKFEDASSELGQLGLYGPRAPEVAEALLPGASALEDDRFAEQDGLIVARGRALAGAGFTAIAPHAAIADLWQRALQAGATPAGEDAWQMLRLKAGLPDGSTELTEDYIPLEANLWPAVSFSKGCYIGQEIIARMESRGKLARRLVSLKLESPVEPGAEVRSSDGPLLGTVTSAATLPDLGPVALAYLKTAGAVTGQTVHVGGTPGVVADLAAHTEQ
jgi:tRNA-modifying protein YgfZ